MYTYFLDPDHASSIREKIIYAGSVKAHSCSQPTFKMSSFVSTQKHITKLFMSLAPSPGPLTFRRFRDGLSSELMAQWHTLQLWLSHASLARWASLITLALSELCVSLTPQPVLLCMRMSVWKHARVGPFCVYYWSWMDPFGSVDYYLKKQANVTAVTKE